MNCPACSRELKTIQVGEMLVDVCYGGCGGIWFDAFELQRVDEASEKPGENLLNILRDPRLVLDMERKRECPRCKGVKLRRHFFSAKRRVEVDECPNCAGYWLDHGELMAIRQERQMAELEKPAGKERVPGEVIRYLYRLKEKTGKQ